MNFWICCICNGENRVAYVQVLEKIFCIICASAIAESYKSYNNSLISKARYFPYRKGDWTP